MQVQFVFFLVLLRCSAQAPRKVLVVPYLSQIGNTHTNNCGVLIGLQKDEWGEKSLLLSSPSAPDVGSPLRSGVEALCGRATLYIHTPVAQEIDIHRERYQAEVGASPRVTLAAERGRKIYVTLR
jgi:hypothetical protein